MRTSCLQEYKIQDIATVWPQIRRFDGLKMDGIVSRKDIAANWSADRGLVFEIPTPVDYNQRLLECWTGDEVVGNPIPPEPAGKILQLDFTGHVIDQVAEQCRINRDDLQKEADQYPDIAAQRINAWLQNRDTLNHRRKRQIEVADVNHMIRAFMADPELFSATGSAYGVMRALKSDRFRLGLDTSDVLGILFKLLNDKKPEWEGGRVDVEVSVNDAKMHATVTNHALTKATKVGDIIAASMYVSTSDIGQGSALVESRAVKLACTNGMKTGYSLKKAHVGSRHQLDDALLSDRTRQLQGAAFASEMYDVMSVCFDDARFQTVIDKMDQAQETPVSPEEAQAVFTTVVQSIGVADTVKDDLFAQFVQEKKGDGSPNFTQDGVIQAITNKGRVLATTDDYQKALPFESCGGTLFQMPGNDFRELVEVAVKDPKVAARRL